MRDGTKAYYIQKGISRKWLNEGDSDRGGAGIYMHWPVTNNEHFKDALQDAADGKSPNNISPIIRYSLKSGITALWMGDLETVFMENVQDDLELEKVDLLFAPHHGRDSGKVPSKMLSTLNPKIIVIGEAPSDHLNYYKGYDTITQNTAGDIVFDCLDGKVRIYTSNWYRADFLDQEFNCQLDGFCYIGTLYL